MGRTEPKPPIQLAIEDLALGGEGVGRYEGKVHFVAGAFPGEVVLAVPLRGRKRWQRARLLEILSTSPNRVRAKCSHTALCGGCVYQCLAYPRQLEAKARQVRETISRIGGITLPEPEPPLAAPKLYHYRNKMEFSFAPRPWDPDGVPAVPEPGPALGLHVPGRYDAVFDVYDCILTQPEINDLLTAVRQFCVERGIPGYHGRNRTGLMRHLLIRSSELTGEWLVALVVRENHPDLRELADLCRRGFPRIAGFLLWIHRGLATVARADEEILLFGNKTIVERLGSLDFELSAASFFQTNSSGAQMLLEALRGMTPQVERILDLYCGVGTLGLGVADRCASLLGVESVEAAVRDARRNAERNGVEHAEFRIAKTEDWLRAVQDHSPDLVLVDPPRAGLHPRALTGLIELSPSEILYVSCNPATLARDLAGLIQAGYEIERFRILDLFPHTPHIETIAKLKRETLDRKGGR